MAVDCARTCVRLGFKDVNIVYRRSCEEMPAIGEEVAEAEKEGVKLHLLAGPNKVVTGAGKVTGVECIKMKLGEPDESGRRRPVPVAGSEFTIETGLIISAIGEEPDLDFMGGGVVTDGYIKADPVTLSTATRGIFAGGDVSSAQTSSSSSSSSNRAGSDSGPSERAPRVWRGGTWRCMPWSRQINCSRSARSMN